MPSIRDNLESVRQRLARAALAAGRDPGEITLVAVTKTFPPETILEGIEAGITIIGENRVQEASRKFDVIGPRVQWHLVGHLQSNKAKKAVEIFSLIHSIDSLETAREVGRRAMEAGKVQDILAEVNTSGEPQKYGVPPPQALDFIQTLSQVPGIRLMGLMTVGPLTEDSQAVRQAFRQLFRLFQEAKSLALKNAEMRYLSMGMSGDFELAIAEGSNLVRIGSAIFGSRA
jgi:pyridoxal phosphate enzyme (YggS family)